MCFTLTLTNTMYEITQLDWIKAQNFYTNNLAEFFDVPPTPSVLERASIKLENLHKAIARRETALVWKIKPQLVVDHARYTFTIEPDLTGSPITIKT